MTEWIRRAMFTKIPTIHQDGAGYTIHPNILLMHVQGLLFTKLWNVINVAFWMWWFLRVRFSPNCLRGRNHATKVGSMHKQAILVTGSRMVGSRPPTLLFCTRGACLAGWRHAVDIIPDIGNIMHTTMQAMHIHKSHPANVLAGRELQNLKI